jgi:hypothetical protein
MTPERAAAQSGHLAPTQASKRGKKDQNAKTAILDPVSQIQHLTHGEHGSFVRLLLTGAPDTARVAGNDQVIDSRRQHCP